MAKGPKGLDRLIRQLRAIPESQAVAASREASASAQRIADKVKRAVPRRAGALPKGRVHLADTVRVESASGGKSRAKSAAGRELAALRAAAKFSYRIVEGGPGAPHALWLEYGTKAAGAGRIKDAGGKSRNNERPHAATPAQPHFFPTIRAQLKPEKARMRKVTRQAAIDVVKAIK